MWKIKPILCDYYDEDFGYSGESLNNKEMNEKEKSDFLMDLYLLELYNEILPLK